MAIFQEPHNPTAHYPQYYDSKRVAARNRGLRLSEARKKGRHTKKDWEEMLLFFNKTCCKCFGESGLLNVEKDHIIPIYQGGSDGLDNLQPLCALCNSGKGAENIDWRSKLAVFLNKELPLKYKLKNG